MKSRGQNCIFFSPLTEPGLPENCDALYLGGGYPELYGEKLSKNVALLEEIRNFHMEGRPIYGECGGFMYLTEGITDLGGTFHELCGIFPAKTIMQTKRASLGYRELTTRCESFWGNRNTYLRGHEFHYSKVEKMEDDIERIYTITNTKIPSTEGYRINNTVGGYMHLHFGFNHDAVAHFIQYCRG